MLLVTCHSWTVHRSKSSVSAARKAAGILHKQQPEQNPQVPHSFFAMSSSELIRPLSCGVCVKSIQPEGVDRVRCSKGGLTSILEA